MLAHIYQPLLARALRVQHRQRVALAVASSQGALLMPVVVAQRLVITGGANPQPWVPTQVMHVHGENFIGLSATDHQLRRFVGTELGNSVLFQNLREHRNRVVDTMVLQYIAAKDPMGFTAKKGNRVSANLRNMIDGADLEPFV